jgi:hypothetical protein
LIDSSPADFGVLQLTTSIYYIINENWGYYERNNTLWVPRLPPEKEFFSLQAYLIKKEKVKPFIKRYFTAVKNMNYNHQKLPQQRDSNKVSDSRSKQKKQQQQARNVQDSKHPYHYLMLINDMPALWGPKKGASNVIVNPELIVYSAGWPAYVLTVPLVRSLDTGRNSTIDGHTLTYDRWHKRANVFADDLVYYLTTTVRTAAAETQAESYRKSSGASTASTRSESPSHGSTGTHQARLPSFLWIPANKSRSICRR